MLSQKEINPDEEIEEAIQRDSAAAVKKMMVDATSSGEGSAKSVSGILKKAPSGWSARESAHAHK